MDLTQIVVVLIGAVAGGFVSGLAGFGTGITALGIWLYVLEPAVAASLVVVCSVISQAQTFPAIARSIQPKRVLPFIVLGLVGVPIGTWSLLYLDARHLKVGVGSLLIVFSVSMLVLRHAEPVHWGGRIADGVVGLIGGVLGGAAGLSGPLPTIWATLRGWSKSESRSVFQAFNLTVLILALGLHALSGFLTKPLLLATMAALPGTIAGAACGAWAYRRLSDKHFRELILVLLGISGAALLWTSIS